MGLRQVCLALRRVSREDGAASREWTLGPWVSRLEVIVQVDLPRERQQTVFERAIKSRGLLVKLLDTTV